MWGLRLRSLLRSLRDLASRSGKGREVKQIEGKRG